MAILRRDDTVQSAMGQAIAGAKVYYLTQPADIQSLTPLATVFGNIDGTVEIVNPQITDGFGHSVAYLDNNQLYTIVWQSPFIGTIVYTDQSVGNAVSSITVNGGVPTGTINGVNVTFTLAWPAPPVFTLFLYNSASPQPNVGFTWVYGSGTITFTLAQAPQEGDSVYAIIFS